MTENEATEASADSLSFARQIAEQFRQFESVKAVALAGSRAAGANDADSDYDFYVYSEQEIAPAFRRQLLGEGAEIDNRFWELGDEAPDSATGARLDIMYRSPRWIEDQLDRVLVRHEAGIGYSTCFWFNVLHSRVLFDPDGWYKALQQKARQPYPENLRRAIVAKNWPILRRNQSSYRHQIELALRRHDAFSIHHRVTALLASFFDIWFALERTPQPGEKRLLRHLPQPWAQRVLNILTPTQDNLLPSIDALLDPLDERLHTEKLFRDKG
jgi:predicted nucleotidyltransferase